MYKPEMDLEMFQLGVGVRPKMVIFCPYTCILGVQTLNGTKWPFSFKMFNPGEGGVGGGGSWKPRNPLTDLST